MAGNAPEGGSRDPAPGVRIARPFGIPVFISPYWFLIAGVFVILYARGLDQSVPANLRYVVAAAFVVLLYASVLVHELSHSVVARAFGLPVRRILLYPLGGVSEIDKEPQTPSREFFVSAAGPALSLVLGAAAWGLSKVITTGVSGSLVTQLLTEEGGKTRLTVTAEYPSRQVRDFVLGTGMERGAAISYDRLEEVASSLAAKAQD